MTSRDDQFAAYRGSTLGTGLKALSIKQATLPDNLFVPSTPPTAVLSANIFAAPGQTPLRDATSSGNSAGLFFPLSRLSAKLLQHSESVDLVFSVQNVPVIPKR
jgi:hypothetical protein